MTKYQEISQLLEANAITNVVAAYEKGKLDERTEWERATGELLIKYAGDICLALPEQVKEIQERAVDQFIVEFIKSNQNENKITANRFNKKLLEFSIKYKESK